MSHYTKIIKMNGCQSPSRWGKPFQHLLPGSSYFTSEGNQLLYQLYVFSDASTKAYRAIVFICNETSTCLVITKTRVALLRQLILLKLEFIAALPDTTLSSLITTPSYKAPEIITSNYRWHYITHRYFWQWWGIRNRVGPSILSPTDDTSV